MQLTVSFIERENKEKLPQQCKPPGATVGFFKYCPIVFIKRKNEYMHTLRRADFSSNSAKLTKNHIQTSSESARLDSGGTKVPQHGQLKLNVYSNDPKVQTHTNRSR